MSLEAIKAAQQKKEQAAAKVTKEGAAHEIALAQGLGVAKSISLKRIILKDGSVVQPTEEGYFIALNAEIAAELDYFASKGLVEVVEAKK